MKPTYDYHVYPTARVQLNGFYLLTDLKKIVADLEAMNKANRNSMTPTKPKETKNAEVK